MKWIDGDYGFEYAKVAGASLSIGWDSKGPKGSSTRGYVATMEIQSRKTKLLEDRDRAKVVIENLLRITCVQILEELGPIPEEVKP